ncbi:hypothetical protein DT076_07230 [Desertihabitans brevis]|uniref:Uncharacterized protein n=1 Tax=Desertihabitans brevis TaxID=2268447 RepID=A0A367YX72_9ACTN|nr:hypothetical protein [Desertihabitans brevis]RCK70428.1 hypothetical protein DT076_07230 [Desertihabitans brevis]
MLTAAQRVALLLVVLGVAPYTTLKVLWLAGSTVGLRSDSGVAELHSTRFVVGNVVTIALELAAVGLAVALTRPWGRRVPAGVVVLLAAGATGLLAPILLGLTVGSALQLAVTGSLRTDGMDNLSPWVFALVYGGFALLGLGLAVLGWQYVLARWAGVLSEAPRRPATWVTVVGGLGLLLFAAASVGWGVLGPGDSGPRGMEAISQRTVLVLSGLLALAGWVAPLLGRAAALRAHLAWILTWLGCTTAALQSVTHVLLAHQGAPTPQVVAISAVALPGSCLHGLAVLRQRVAEMASDNGSPVRARA